MKIAMLAQLCLLPAAAILAACVGTNSVQIETQPPAAKLYVNDKYVGMTPQHVPYNFNNWVGETIKVTMVKDGYQTRKETITDKELNQATAAGHWGALNSEYGWGNSYTISYPLESVGSAAPAPAPVVRPAKAPAPAPVARKPKPAEPAPKPPSSQSWR